MEEELGIGLGATAEQGTTDSSWPLQRIPEPPFSGQGGAHLPEERHRWDGAKAFLVSFEELANACRWPPGEWVAHLLPALRGDTQQALGRLEAREDYGKAKAAILKMEATKLEPERSQGAITWLRDLCRLWLNIEKQTQERVREHFLALLPAYVQPWVRDAGTLTCSQAVAIVEDFLQKQQMLEEEILNLCDTDQQLLSLETPAEGVGGAELSAAERSMNVWQEANRTPQSLEQGSPNEPSVATAGGNVPRSQEQVFGGQHRLGQLLETQRENVGGRVSSGGGKEGEKSPTTNSC